MGYETRISTKGQLVLPKAVRERHQWASGQIIEVVDVPGGVMLRPKLPAADAEKAREILARIAARSTYRGPVVTLDKMKEAVSAAAVARYERSL